MANKKVFRRVLSVLLVLALLASGIVYTPVSVFAQTDQQRYEELQRELEEIQRRINELNRQISAGENVYEAARQKKLALEAEARILEEQITIAEAEITRKEAEIETKTREIFQKQQQLDENDRLFRERIVAIYKMNNAGILSTLLAVTSFTEFLTLVKYLQLISQNDTAFLDMLSTQKDEMEAARAELQTMLDTLEAERAEMQEKLDEYKRSIAEQEAVMSETMKELDELEQKRREAYAERERAQEEMEEVWRSLGGSGSGVYVGGALLWPVPAYNGSNYITSSYGWRTLYGQQNFHTGIDIAGAGCFGSAIVAANAGTVVYVVNNSNVGYGNYLIIDHGGGNKTLYAHCSEILVYVGKEVYRGEPVAKIGSTGNSTGPHLHFELRINDTQKVDPYPYLAGQKDL